MGQLTMPVIGLTGGIASGKSTALKVFKRLGAVAIDADSLARKAVAPGTPGWRAVKSRWGNKVFHKNGRLNRAALAAVIFKNPFERKALNAIVHPEVFRMEKELIAARQKRKKKAVIVVDAAVMLESGSHTWKDAVVVVAANEKEQLARLMRGGMKKPAALARIRAQMPLREKLKYADYVVENNGSLAACRKNAAAVFAQILSDYRR
ncbi:MAG: dephospho-CoA kinase [Nitrospinae bacterium]|nr:dephospho-CoA kinase [Nitrospinota bacterium]